MKRCIAVLVLLAALAVTAGAKPRSVGIGAGAVQSVSMQHMVYGTDNVFQLDLGFHVGVPSSGTMRLMATYNIMLFSPEWTSEGKWNVYAGPGVSLGAGFSTAKALTFGVTAIAGVEYLFDSIPLQLSADLRPTFGIMLSNDTFRFDVDGMMGFVPTISARYMF